MRSSQANVSTRTQLQDGDFWSCKVKCFQKGQKVMRGPVVPKMGVGNSHNVR